MARFLLLWGFYLSTPCQRRNPTQALYSTPLPATEHTWLSAACQSLCRTRPCQPWLHGHPGTSWCPAHTSQSSRAKTVAQRLSPTIRYQKLAAYVLRRALSSTSVALRRALISASVRDPIKQLRLLSLQQFRCSPGILYDAIIGAWQRHLLSTRFFESRFFERTAQRRAGTLLFVDAQGTPSGPQAGVVSCPIEHSSASGSVGEDRPGWGVAFLCLRLGRCRMEVRAYASGARIYKTSWPLKTWLCLCRLDMTAAVLV